MNFLRYFLLTACLATGLFMTTQGMEEPSLEGIQSPAGPWCSDDEQSPMRTLKRPVTLSFSAEVVAYFDCPKIEANTPYPVATLIEEFFRDSQNLVVLLHHIIMHLDDADGAPFVKQALALNPRVVLELDEQDMTILIYAAGLGKTRMLFEILQHNQNIDYQAPGYHNFTALMMAANRCHVECVAMLLIKGARPFNNLNKRALSVVPTSSPNSRTTQILLHTGEYNGWYQTSLKSAE